MAKTVDLKLIGQVVGHELLEKTESGGYPVKVKLRCPQTVAGELFKNPISFVIDRDDLAQYPLGKGIDIRLENNQTGFDFDADPDEEGDGEDGDDAPNGRARGRGRRSSGAPASAN
jgi:hypothetical protein